MSKHETFAAALAAAQARMENPHKGAANPHFKSKYADLAACLDAVRGPLNEAGIALTQPADVENGVLVVATELRWGAETIRLSQLALPAPAKPQDLGSAITYLRRYSLCASLAVAGDDDDDGNAAQRSETNAPAARRPEPRAVAKAAPAPPRDELRAALSRAGCSTKADADAVSTLLLERPCPPPEDTTGRNELLEAMTAWWAQRSPAEPARLLSEALDLSDKRMAAAERAAKEGA